MGIKIWWIWMALAAIFIVGEIFTAGFFLMWFGIGAAAAGIVTLVGLGPAWQLGAFVIVSGVLFAVSRRLADKITKKQPPGVGADRFIGIEGIVLEEIDNQKNTGRVRLKNEDWRANSETTAIISKGTRVEVVGLDGTHLIVREKKEG